MLCLQGIAKINSAENHLVKNLFFKKNSPEILTGMVKDNT
jgi:hypothetical protein